MGLEDYDLWLRIKDRVNFYNLKYPLMLLRYNKNSITRRNLDKTNLQVYELQKEYSQNNFNIGMDRESCELLGWREYFYGSKRLSRKYWSQNKKIMLRNFRVLIAYISTYFPDRLFKIFKEERLKLRFNYLFRTDSKIKNKLKNSLQILAN